MLRVDVLPGIGRRVVGGPFSDPAADQPDFLLRERRLLFRHLGLAIHGGDVVDEERFVGIAWDDGEFSLLRALAPTEELREIGHHVPALRPSRLMAPLALRLKDWPHLLEV